MVIRQYDDDDTGIRVLFAELMLLGFISLLLTVFQSRISKICISEEASKKWLPCEEEDDSESTTSHFQAFFFSPGISRRLLAEDSSEAISYCTKKASRRYGHIFEICQLI